MNNLVLLCRHHHRLLHEGAYSIENESKDGSNGESEGESGVVFISSAGQLIPSAIYPQFEETAVGESAYTMSIVAEHEAMGLVIDDATGVSAWQGEKMDYNLAVGAMCRGL